MARVFLSHSSRDNGAAAELKSWLDGQGFAPAFLDFDKHSGIPAGADWERTLYEQIQCSQALLILQTPNWSASRWCFAEFTQARALGKPIFQVVESDEGAAEKPIAADLQRLDLRQDRPAGLEQLRRELELIALQDQGGFPWPPPNDPSRPPFPGLMVFEAEDAPVFFGRDSDWRVVNERLNTRRVQGGPRLLVLQGSSGAGKSSLLRAGVLPRLRRAGRQWLVLPVMRPQARPLESLVQTLALALQRPQAWRELHQQLLTTTEAPALAGLVAGWAADLRLAAAAPEAQLLLPIDQAEELFTVAEAGERKRFVDVLAAVLHPPLPLQAVMTIRADAMGSLQALPELVNNLETLPLGPLSLERYREIIEGPARVAGLRVEPAFVERGIHDTATEDALPLLAFALRQLHEQYGADGVLSLSDYQSLGDPAAGLSPLENAVKQAADGVLQALRPDEASLKALREAFVPAMVRVGKQGSYARRAAIWDTLPQAARPLLEALVAARLLVRRQSEGQGSTVEVAHEALLRVWPLLRGWLDDSRDFLLGSQQLEEDLAQWKTAKPAEKPMALLSGLKLAKGRAWLAERGDQMGPELRAFILASQKRFKRQRRILLFSAVGVFTSISCAAGLAYWQAQRADAEAIKATQQATRLRGILLLVGKGSLAKSRLAGFKSQPTKPLDLRSLKLIMPSLPKEKAEIFLPYLQVLMNMFEINTPARQAAFLAAIASETSDLKYLQEVENGMMYENRPDLGNIYPGDGPRFKGRGAFQFVGRANYEQLGKLIDIDLASNPDQLASSQEIALLVAAIYWDMNGLNEKVDNDDMTFVRTMLGLPKSSFQKQYDQAIRTLRIQ
jgi:predicted chitinase